MTYAVNPPNQSSSILPYYKVTFVWTSGVSGDIDFTVAQLPRGIACVNAGDLSVTTTSDQTQIIPAGSDALQMLLACGCIKRLNATGSTAYPIMVGY